MKVKYLYKKDIEKEFFLVLKLSNKNRFEFYLKFITEESKVWKDNDINMPKTIKKIVY